MIWPVKSTLHIDYLYTITLKEVRLIGQRQGTGTEIVKWFIEYGFNHNFSLFMVDGVTSNYMHKICTRLKFHPEGSIYKFLFQEFPQ